MTVTANGAQYPPSGPSGSNDALQSAAFNRPPDNLRNEIKANGNYDPVKDAEVDYLVGIFWNHEC